MAGLLGAIGDALLTALDMFWEVLWPLILGFGLSGIVQAVVSHQAMARLLGALGIIPRSHNVGKFTEGVQWNHTTWLNIAFLVVAALLFARFLRTGGPEMLGIMAMPEDTMMHGHDDVRHEAMGAMAQEHGGHNGD